MADKSVCCNGKTFGIWKFLAYYYHEKRCYLYERQKTNWTAVLVLGQDLFFCGE